MYSSVVANVVFLFVVGGNILSVKWVPYCFIFIGAFDFVKPINSIRANGKNFIERIIA